MPIYAWRGRNAQGDLAQGQYEAMTPEGVADHLLALGLVPVQIELTEQTREKSDSWLEQLQRRSVTLDDTLIFSRQMYTLNKAGVPILRAFAGLEASAEKPAFVDVLKDVRGSLDQGRDMATSLARHPTVFGPFYVAMIRVGEMSGKMTEVFLRLAEHLEFERDVRARVKQALRYPSFVVLAILVAIVIINLFVLPVFAKVFAGFNAPLPLITRGLLGFSSFMVNWWPVLLVMVILAVMGVRAYLQSPAGRYNWDRRKLTLPIVGPIILKATLGRFARSFALSSQAGVPLVQALTVVAQTVDNVHIGSRIEQMRDGIERGESIARCAAATGIFTPVVLQMIQVGEETGELDNLLFEIAEMYERDTDYAIKGLSTAIEPVLLAFIGVLVLLLALGVFLPLWNLGQAAMGRGGG